jgi:hypothetical protein
VLGFDQRLAAVTADVESQKVEALIEADDARVFSSRAGDLRAPLAGHLL